MQLNIVLRTDTNDALSILFEGTAEDAMLWAEDFLVPGADYESAHIETRFGQELFFRPAEGAWGGH